MKALSLWQPWASLVFEPLPPRSEFETYTYKMVETRGWSTDYRGPLAIAATAGVPGRLGLSRLRREFVNALPAYMKNVVLLRNLAGATEFKTGMQRMIRSTLPRGCVLGIVDLKDVRPVEEVRDDLNARERIFGNYSSPEDNGGEQRYAWFFENFRQFVRPIAVSGNRKLWNWTPNVTNYVELVNGSKLDMQSLKAEADRCEINLRRGSASAGRSRQPSSGLD